MKRHIRTKFLAPILILQIAALSILGLIGYRFSSNMLKSAAEQRFSRNIDMVYNVVEGTLAERIDKLETLLRNPVFIKFFAAPYYKSDVDIDVFNFQRGNGLALGEPEVGGLVNYPIGLLANEGNRKIIDRGIFPSEEYVGADGFVRQHVYLGGSNDVDFEAENRQKLDRSQEEWFREAMSGKIFVGRPQTMPIYLREYDPVKISTGEVKTNETLIPIALPHRIGDKVVGVLMATTPPDFIYGALPDKGFQSMLLIADSKGGKVAEFGDTSIEKEIKPESSGELESEDRILSEGDLLAVHRGLKSCEWSISMYGRKAYIFEGVYKLRTKILFVIALSTALMGIIVFAIIQKLLRPIMTLKSASDRIAGGELGVTIDKTDDDEIGQLTDSFNKMSVSTKRMHDRMSRINYIRKQLLHIISHELRTPLNGIMGFYDLIKDEIESGDIKIDNADEFNECFDGLGTSIEKYRRLVERLTKTTSVMSGEMQSGLEVDLETCNLAEEVSFSIEEARRYTKDVACNATKADVQNITVACPRDALRLLMEEALSNAVKYSPENSPIEVSIGREGNSAKIVVRDSGPGIPKEYVDDVIEPFFEVQDSKLHFTDRYRKGGGGLGLGLTIIGSILRRYQGTLKIESDEGKGTTLVIMLPIHFS